MTEAIFKPIPRSVDYEQETITDLPRLNLGLRPVFLLALAGGVVVMFLLNMSMGSVDVPEQTVIRALLGNGDTTVRFADTRLSSRAVADNLFGSYDEIKRGTRGIVNKFRLPKATTATIAGAALGVSGLMMQTLFRNPLAGPFVLGISSGASLGVALVVLSAGAVTTVAALEPLLAGRSAAGDLQLAAAASIGGAVTMGLVLLVGFRVRNSMTLLILGLMISYLTSALVSLLLYFAQPERIQAYIQWTFGSFRGVTLDQIPILGVPVVVGLILALLLIKPLNALLLGEAYARSLGVNLWLARTTIITATAILTGVVTAFCGPIGFIGIAVPHLCRTLMQTSDHRMLVPATILMGAIVALTANLIAEAPGDNIILPLNAVTALIGAPIVIMVILRQRNLQQAFGA